MLARSLRHLLFNLVHLVLTVLVAIKQIHRWFWTTNFQSSHQEVTRNDVELILKRVPQLRKKLHHLVIMANTHHSLEDLALIVIWSLVAGVPYISFFDTTGDLAQEKLFLEVERRKKGIPGCIKWCNKPDLNGYTNGAQAHTIIVNILSHKDGRPKITDCIKKIANNEIPYNCSSNEFTAEEFDKTLHLMYPPIPDPDLVLYSGPVCCTYGLLPWQIRLTEFVQLSVDYCINVDTFLGALNKYSKCDQRFGK